MRRELALARWSYKRVIEYIAEECSEKGIKIIEAEERWSSITCHRCGSRNTERPCQSIIHCYSCGLNYNADFNAAINIGSSILAMPRSRGVQLNHPELRMTWLEKPVVHTQRERFGGDDMLKTPLVLVNFKTYPEATGKRAIELSKIIEEVAVENGVSAAVAPQYADIYRVATEVKIPVIAQHVDPVTPGRNTGFVTVESVKAAGGVGTLVNHSEHKLQLAQIEEVVRLARKAEFATIACAADVEESAVVAKFGPDMILIEPPELVGTGIPVSKAKPEVVRNSVKAIKRVNARVKILCGAGITAGEDVTKAIELGTEGVGVASGVVCAKDQRAAFENIVGGVIKARS